MRCGPPQRHLKMTHAGALTRSMASKAFEKNEKNGHFLFLLSASVRRAIPLSEQFVRLNTVRTLLDKELQVGRELRLARRVVQPVVPLAPALARE